MKNPTYQLNPQIGVAVLALAAALITFTPAVSPANAADEKADKPAAEEGKSATAERDGESPREGARDGEKPREGARDGEKSRGSARDGESPNEGARDGEKPREGARDGEKPREGARDGEKSKGSARDGEMPKEGARDGESPKRGARDGEKPREGARDGEKPSEGTNSSGSGEKMNSNDRDIFNAYDKDSDGMVSDEEMATMFAGKQNSSGRRQIQKEIDRSDKDKDGKLNGDEFLFWYKVGRLDEKAENE